MSSEIIYWWNPFNQTETVQWSLNLFSRAVYIIRPTYPSKCFFLFAVGPDIRCSSFALLEKKTLEGKCSVTGNPTPHVEWLKEGRLVNLTAPFSRNDAGTYMIKVEGLISIKKNITIDVLCESQYILKRFTMNWCSFRDRHLTPHIQYFVWVAGSLRVELIILCLTFQMDQRGRVLTHTPR